MDQATSPASRVSGHDALNDVGAQRQTDAAKSAGHGSLPSTASGAAPDVASGTRLPNDAAAAAAADSVGAVGSRAPMTPGHEAGAAALAGELATQLPRATGPGAEAAACRAWPTTLPETTMIMMPNTSLSCHVLAMCDACAAVLGPTVSVVELQRHMQACPKGTLHTLFQLGLGSEARPVALASGVQAAGRRDECARSAPIAGPASVASVALDARAIITHASSAADLATATPLPAPTTLGQLAPLRRLPPAPWATNLLAPAPALAPALPAHCQCVPALRGAPAATLAVPHVLNTPAVPPLPPMMLPMLTMPATVPAIPPLPMAMPTLPVPGPPALPRALPVAEWALPAPGPPALPPALPVAEWALSAPSTLNLAALAHPGLPPAPRSKRARADGARASAPAAAASLAARGSGDDSEYSQYDLVVAFLLRAAAVLPPRTPLMPGAVADMLSLASPLVVGPSTRITLHRHVVNVCTVLCSLGVMRPRAASTPQTKRVRVMAGYEMTGRSVADGVYEGLRAGRQWLEAADEGPERALGVTARALLLGMHESGVARQTYRSYVAAVKAMTPSTSASTESVGASAYRRLSASRCVL